MLYGQGFVLFSDEWLLFRWDCQAWHKAGLWGWQEKLLATDKFSERTPGLFKPDFVGTRGVWLTAKCYLVQNEARINKYSCKGVSKKHNDLYFQRYKDVLVVLLKSGRGSELTGKDIDKAKNVGSRLYDQGMVTYEQSKLGLSAY